MIWTKAFWKGLGERAIKTFIQSFAGALVAALGGVVTGVGGAVGLDSWVAALVAALSAAVLATLGSIGMSFGNSNFVAGGSPSEVTQSDTNATVVVNTPAPVSIDADEDAPADDEFEDVDDSDIAPDEDDVAPEEELPVNTE